MPENSNTPGARRDLEIETRPFALELRVRGRSDNEVRPDEHYAASLKCSLFLGAMLWTLQQVGHSYLSREDSQDIAAMLNHYGELGGLINDAASRHLEGVECERRELERALEGPREGATDERS